MTALLAVDAVTKHFKGLTALNHVSFEVARGEILAVIGPNGAGKTTLFNVITGFERPDDGGVTLAGEKITGLRPTRSSAGGWRAHSRFHGPSRA